MHLLLPSLADNPSLARFPYRDRTAPEIVSSGASTVDAIVGGLPRGALIEICGPACSGRTSLFLSALAARTAQGEICGLIDGNDNFDAAFAAGAGAKLEQLLWVRCSKLALASAHDRAGGSARGLEQALRATDLLIQAGGFGLIALDLSDVSPRLVRQIPLSLWFRLRRAVEDTPTILVLLEQEANAKTCASLVLRFAADSARWHTTQPHAACPPTPAHLLAGLSIRMDVVRSRLRSFSGSSVVPVIGFSPREFSPPPSHTQNSAARPGVLQTETVWQFSHSRLSTP